jgi:hypothetical protein
MSETVASRVAWHRRGPGPTYVGAVSRGPEAVRLSGRDLQSGIDVALTIPVAEIEHVGVEEPADGSLHGERCVVLALADSEAIYLRPFGDVPLHVNLLARALGAPTPPAAVLTQGGRT